MNVLRAIQASLRTFGSLVKADSLMVVGCVACLHLGAAVAAETGPHNPQPALSNGTNGKLWHGFNLFFLNSRGSVFAYGRSAVRLRSPNCCSFAPQLSCYGERCCVHSCAWVIEE